MKSFINSILSNFDVKLVDKSSYEALRSKADKYRDYELSSLIDEKYFVDYFANLQFSKSQLRQDLFVLSELGFKERGFFVEFGATNGVDLSNTHIMESRFKWDGVLAEPAKIWHHALMENRSVAIETDCVWRATGETLLFNEVNDRKHDGELSTIDQFTNSDKHAKSRNSASNKYEVNTISLSDMLKKHNAPKEIDYLSIDTEGSEFEILNSFDFDEYDIKVITCEHNFTPMREKVYSLLTGNGYKRKYSEYSQFDDWYVRVDDL
ncbi:FkbM family methyltransferase [Roseobacteraceae bacterium S113]